MYVSNDLYLQVREAIEISGVPHHPHDRQNLKKQFQNLFDRFRNLARLEDVAELLDHEAAGVGHGEVGELDRG